MFESKSFSSTPCKFLLPVALFGYLVLGVSQAASAQSCLKTAYGKNVQCTANDVRIAYADNVRALDGSKLTSCQKGSTFNFVADFHVTTTATARENIGMYFATGGQGNALTGTCSANIISPKHWSENTNDKVQLGSNNYIELDAATPTDNCGDISTAYNNQVVTVEIDNALCESANASGQLSLPNCTSWQQPGGTLLCSSPEPYYPWVAAAIPGSPSKCNCDNSFTVPIIVQSPGVTVKKSCTTTNSPGIENTSCDAGPEGGDVTYTVAITNASNFGDVVIDKICDTAYGNVFPVPPSTSCTAGTVGTVTGTDTCTGMTIAKESTGTCSFVVKQGELTTVKNVVNVSGHGASGNTAFGPTPSNEVTVTSTDAPTTGTITKSVDKDLNICATLRYMVDVKNTSGADETLTLSALDDDQFGVIVSATATRSSLIPETTCEVPQTLAVNGGHYECTFDAQFCAAPSTITIATGTCLSKVCTGGKAGDSCEKDSDCSATCYGIQHTNKVSATLTGDEGETVSLTPGSLTASRCITSQ